VATVPAISYPSQLPVSEHREELLEVLRDNQVVVVAGETGSGKTTQLPKICLELGRTSIAHTQPRRIAARTVVNATGGAVERLLGSIGLPTRMPLLMAMNLVTTRDAGDAALGGRSASGRNRTRPPCDCTRRQGRPTARGRVRRRRGTSRRGRADTL
jgi:glycine/D-amino acid oxidase-like deaminating enzyme